jgi:chitinase
MLRIITRACLVSLLYAVWAAPTFAAPSVPTALASTNLKATSFTLKWAASTGGVVGYDIYQNGMLIGSTSTARTFAVLGLSPATTYAMTVTARDTPNHVSAPSAPLSVVTPADTTNPSKPANLAASNITTTSCTLGWTASTDDVGVTGYNIYRSGVLIGSTPLTAYDLTSLGASENSVV